MNFYFTSNTLCPWWNVNVQQFFNGQGITLFIAHHRNVIQTVHVGQTLKRNKKICQITAVTFEMFQFHEKNSLSYLACTSCIPSVFRCHGAKDQYEDRLLKQSHHQVAKPNAKIGKRKKSENFVKSQLLHQTCLYLMRNKLEHVQPIKRESKFPIMIVKNDINLTRLKSISVPQAAQKMTFNKATGSVANIITTVRAPS